METTLFGLMGLIFVFGMWWKLDRDAESKKTTKNPFVRCRLKRPFRLPHTQ